MAATPKLWQAALPVLDCLEELRVPHLLGGWLAGKLWGLTRRTPQDIPIIAPLTPAHAAPLVAALEGSYYADAGKIAQTIRRQSCFQLIHLRTMLRIDISVAEDSPFIRSVMARRIGREIAELQGRIVPFSSPEDVVLGALLSLPRHGAAHPGWEEIQEGLRLSATTLDLAYIRTWARRLDLMSLLDRALERSEQSR